MLEMNSKQEKLAAARKKLKEFQVKQRDLDSLKQNTMAESILNTKCESNTSHTTVDCSYVLSTLNTEGVKSFENHQKPFTDSTVSSENCLKANFQESEKNKLEELELYSEDENLSMVKSKNFNDEKNKPSENFNCLEKNIEEKIKSDNGNSKNNFNTSSLGFPTSTVVGNILKDDKNDYKSLQNKSILSPTQTIFQKSSFYCDPKNQMLVPANPHKESFQKEFITQNDGNDSAMNLNSMQLELQNHIQTINILIQQRNEVQNTLIHAQGLLNEKSGEVEQQKQSIINLTFEINELNKRLSDISSEYKSFKSENEKIMKKYKDAQANVILLQSQFDAKNEEFLELNKKYEGKKKECEKLENSLSESQSQLSLCLIQLQQLSNEGSSELSVKISDLQHDNLTLRHQFENLKKQLEIVHGEKDQSEQKFHLYAQQCNSQIGALNSQIKSLAVEKEKLKQDNDSLLRKLSDIENENNRKLLIGDRKNEMEELYSQLNNLTETNKNYQDDCQKKVEEIKILHHEMKERENEIKSLTDRLNEADIEKQNLLVEMESAKANKRLLAAIESDKIAAAKAVSQNQKLKSQVAEFEEAFVKLSEEKLRLTEQLAHEKHINKELQDKIETLNSHQSHQNNCRQIDHSDDLCKNKSNDIYEALINDSNEIEELRNIIRQLQNDKMELKARLNTFSTLEKNSGDLHNSAENLFTHDPEKDELENKSSKLLLHQMEEKVRKTMNEIAVLDEEKEKLEHLVMQLQGETETIGEYITLYQRQRMLLRQRAQEKDNQLIQLSKDKEELRSKLVALDELVQLLIKERNTYNKQADIIYSAPASFKPTEETSNNTAGKIRALISEIGSTNLINNQSVGIEHCSCCSGRLITI